MESCFIWSSGREVTCQYSLSLCGLTVLLLADYLAQCLKGPAQ